MTTPPLRIAAPGAPATPGPLTAGDVDLARHATPEALAPAMLMNANDLARELSVSVKTIRRLDQSGKLPRAVKIGAHAVRWHRETIVRWIAAGAPARDEWEAFHAPRTKRGGGR